MVWWFNTQVNPSHPSAKHNTAMAAMGSNRPTKLHHFGTEASHILEFSAVWSYFEPCLSSLNFINHGFPWVFNGVPSFSQPWTVGPLERHSGTLRQESPPWDSTRHRTWWPNNLPRQSEKNPGMIWCDGCSFIYLAIHLYLSVWLQL